MSQSISINIDNKIDNISVNIDSIKSSVVNTSKEVNSTKPVETLDFSISATYDKNAKSQPEEVDLNATPNNEDKAALNSSKSAETKGEPEEVDLNASSNNKDKMPLNASGTKDPKDSVQSILENSNLNNETQNENGNQKGENELVNQEKTNEKPIDENPPDYRLIKKKKTKQETDKEIAEKELEGMISQGMTKFVDDDGKQYTVYFFIDKKDGKQSAVGVLVLDEDGNVVKVMKSTDKEDIKKYGHCNDAEYVDGKIYIATINHNDPLIAIDFDELISDSTNSFDDLHTDSKKELMDIIKEKTDYEKIARKIQNEEKEANKKDPSIKVRDLEDIIKAVKSGEINNASGIACDKSTNPPTWYVSSGRYITIIRDGEVVDTIVKPKDLTRKNRIANGDSDDTLHDSQGIYARDGKLYVIRYNKNSEHTNGEGNVTKDDPNASKNIVDVFDSEGNYEGSYPIEVDTHNGNMGELESISYDEKEHKFVANFYYKEDSNDDSSRGMTEGEISFD